MYTVTVREHIMIAHSFRGKVFGPAQALHGATYVVDVEFQRQDLDPDNIVVDIGLAQEVLRKILGEYNFRNLDDLPEFEGMNTTTEFMAEFFHGRMSDAIVEGRLGPHAGGLSGLKVTLHESHVARAGYEGPLGGTVGRI